MRHKNNQLFNQKQLDLCILSSLDCICRGLWAMTKTATFLLFNEQHFSKRLFYGGGTFILLFSIWLSVIRWLFKTRSYFEHLHGFISLPFIYMYNYYSCFRSRLLKSFMQIVINGN